MLIVHISSEILAQVAEGVQAAAAGRRIIEPCHAVCCQQEHGLPEGALRSDAVQQALKFQWHLCALQHWHLYNA